MRAVVHNYYYRFFFTKKYVLLALQRCSYYAGIKGARVGSLGGQMTLKLWAQLWSCIIFAFFTKKIVFFEKVVRWRTYTNETFGARKWLPNDPQIMRAAIENYYFCFFHEKMRFDRFEKMPTLRWDLGRSSGLPWRPNDP